MWSGLSGGRCLGLGMSRSGGGCDRSSGRGFGIKHGEQLGLSGRGRGNRRRCLARPDRTEQSSEHVVFRAVIFGCWLLVSLVIGGAQTTEKPFQTRLVIATANVHTSTR